MSTIQTYWLVLLTITAIAIETNLATLTYCLHSNAPVFLNRIAISSLLSVISVFKRSSLLREFSLDKLNSLNLSQSLLKLNLIKSMQDLDELISAL